MSIRNEIQKKLNPDTIYYPSSKVADKIITDIDQLPYPRFYRGGEAMEREAGVRKDGMYIPFHYYFKGTPNCEPTCNCLIRPLKFSNCE